MKKPQPKAGVPADWFRAQKRVRRKARFRVGEVVFYKTRGTWVKVMSEFDDEGHCRIIGHEDGWCHKSELRPLNFKVGMEDVCVKCGKFFVTIRWTENRERGQ